MSKLDELIKELCPNGVEYKKIREVSDFITGFAFKSSLFRNEGYPICKTTNINNGYIDFAFMQYFDLNDYSENLNKYIVDYQKIVIGMSGTIKVGINKLHNKCYLNQRVGMFTPYKELNNKYLYYVLCNSIDDLIQNVDGGSVKNLSNEIIKEYEIPVPPLPIQEEIVRILDNFTELTAKLTAELQDRKKQYEYYRDSLLTFNNDIKKVKLKDIAIDMYRGNGITRDQVVTEGFPCVRYGEIYTTYNTYFDKCVSHTKLEEISSPKFIEYGDLLFAITGESIEDIGKTVAYVGKDKCLVGGDILVLKHNQNPKCLSYALATSSAVEQKGKGKVKSKVVHTNAESIGNIEIYLPSLDVQNRIVDVLDNFEKICNDLKIGLPAEIELRQKQYEYYRDKLLNFKKIKGDN